MSRNGRYGTTERRILPNSGSMGTIEVLTAHASPWAIYEASVEIVVSPRSCCEQLISPQPFPLEVHVEF